MLSLISIMPQTQDGWPSSVRTQGKFYICAPPNPVKIILACSKDPLLDDPASIYLLHQFMFVYKVQYSVATLLLGKFIVYLFIMLWSAVLLMPVTFASGACSGISLTTEQWSAFRKSVPAIEEAIMKMESRMKSEDVSKQIEADVSDSVTAFASQGLIPVERKQIEADMPNSVTAFTPQGVIPNGRKQVEADMSNLAPTFAPQGLIPIETTRLDGKNYYCWVHQMEFFLKQLKIAYVLTEPCPSITLSPEASVEEIAQARAAAQKWADDNYICRRNILNSLSDHLFDQYSNKTYSAKELWEELKLVYDEDFGTKRSLVNKYIQFQMADGIPILEQVQELHNIAASIIASGMWIDDNFHISTIISKLPQSWKESRMRLMHEEFLPLNMLMYRLRVEEESRSRNKRGEPSTKEAHCADSKLENKLGPKKREMKRPGMYWEMEKDNKAIVCYNCGKKGHISRHCHRRKFDIREKENEKDNEAVPVVTEVDMVEGIVE
uniref:CCHC-type domain-containing protein n=1 Tax=Davidia involucrata TaxID=16924 RepID=A0A5B7AER8_DAVIN